MLFSPRRDRSPNWVHCPVCEKHHHKEPRGEALRHHRMRLMLCDPQAIEEWKKISAPKETS